MKCVRTFVLRFNHLGVEINSNMKNQGLSALSSSQQNAYVLDTSVLLAEPSALRAFGRHEVVLPLVVLIELEQKRNHPELGWAARSTLRELERLRTEYGQLQDGVPVNDDGGTVRIEFNYVEVEGMHHSFVDGSNDSRILAVARGLANEGRNVTLLSKDLPLRLRASLVEVPADDYRGEVLREPNWTGIETLEVSSDVVDELFENKEVPLDDEYPVNTGIILHAGESQSALARVSSDGWARLVHGERELFGVRGRSSEQRIALELLADPTIGIVSLGGRAGTGKSILAIAAGLDAVIEQQTQRRVLVFRPLFAVGGQDLGYLPGDSDEKMSPWGDAVSDALDAIASPAVIEEVREREIIEVLPLTHIRGRTLTDSFIVIDEAQNLERSVLLTALSRVGENSKVVLTHDVAQRDNLRVGRDDGIVSVVNALRGHGLFAHVTLQRSERSAVAALVTDLLDAGLESQTGASSYRASA